MAAKTVETLERASAKERDNASFYISILDRLLFLLVFLVYFSKFSCHFSALMGKDFCTRKADFLHQKRLTMHFLAKKMAAFALK